MSTDKISNENAANAAKPTLTRIPLEQAWFTGEAGLDFPGGNAIAHSMVFGPPKVKGRQYFLGFFVPSYQVIDIEYYKDSDEPEVFSVPMTAVRKIKRSAKKP